MYLISTLGLCETPGFLRVLYLIKLLLHGICIVAPIILIIYITIDVSKVVIDPVKNELQALLSKEVKRVMAALIIFFIPTIVNFAFTLVPYDDNFITECYSKLDMDYILDLEEQIIENAKVESEMIDPSVVESAIKEVVKKSQETNEIIDKAINWAVAIANDNSHGYSNVYGYQLGQNGQYNCIGLVSMAYVNAGVDLYAEGNFDINKMYKRYLNHDFVDVTDSINLKNGDGLQKGDVVWRVNGDGHGHTEMYIGNGKLVGARSDNGGGTADVDGNEIAVSAYYNMPWQKVLRYRG